MSHETLIRMFRIGIVISEIKSEHRKRILTGESAVTPEHKWTQADKWFVQPTVQKA